MKNGLIFALILLIFNAKSQTVGNLSGTVSNDGAGLPLASVKLLKSSYAIATDSSGKFSFKNIGTGKYQLKVTYVGFENYQTEIKILAGQTTTLNIPLNKLSAGLKEVVITGTLRESGKLESVTPVEVYTARYFQRNPTSNLFEALQNVNGLFADMDNGVSNTNDVQINGLEGNYTMFLIDGVPMLNGLAGTYSLNALPMNIIDKVEIVKGAGSTLYGSEAIAGVINIKTKQPNASPKFFVNASLSSMLEANADIGTSFRIKKASSLLSVSTENFNTIWDLDKNGFRDMPFINRVSVFNKWKFERKENRIFSIYGRYLYEDRFGGETYPSIKWRGNPKYYSESVRTHQWEAGLVYQLPLKENVQLQLDYSEHRQNGFYGVNKYFGLQASLFAQLTWNKKINPNNELVAGITYRSGYFKDNTELTRELITGYSNLSHLAGVFFEDEISFSNNHKLMVGARLEYNNRTFPMALPRINYKWNSKKEKDILRIGIGSGYRIPSVLNEGFGAMNGSRQIEIDEKLKPEIAITSSTGYTRVQEFTDGLVSIDANLFYTYFINFINPEYPADTALIEYSNSDGGAMAGGVSINADFTFNFPLKLGVGFTYSRTVEINRLENGEKEYETPVHQPPFTGQFYLSYNFPQPQLSIDWTGTVVSPMHLSVVEKDFRPSMSKWYTIQNIQMVKRFNVGVEIFFGIKNFFNFLQKDPILRPFDPFNRNVTVDNPNNYRFDTTYGWTSSQGIKGFLGIRYVLK